MADINQLVNRAEEFMVKAPYLPLGLAKEMIAALKEQTPQWISVKDRLPSEHDSLFAKNQHLSKYMWAKESDDVIVYAVFPDGTGRATEGRLRDGKWNTKISPMLESVITHWMSMPEPPKDGDA